MSIRGLKKWALLLTFWVALQSRCLKATDITGDTVTTDLTVEGSTISSGIDGSYPGWLAFYTDGSTSVVEFDARHSGNIWKWQQNGGGTSLQVQMKLDSGNVLTLYNSSGTANVTLSPTGTSIFTGSVTLNGASNTMPNQGLTGGPSSVLTEGLADNRYVSSSSMTIGSAISPWGDAISNLGLNGGTATGGASLASGSYSTASGYSSTAVGVGATAIGFGSTSMGYNTTASGYYSTAMGYYTSASAYDSFVMGTCNVGLNASGGTASATSWVATDPLFEVGNGGNGYGGCNPAASGPSDALVVYKNGNAVVQGNVTTGGSISTTGITSTGAISAGGVITAQPGGDIPTFTGN